ncbi:MAG: tol-pal system-associated acyl-CoA thioesterase [Pseudomonadota bacterium]
MTFQFPVRVYWEDTDAGGIVFYANYLKFFERARTEWLRSRGLEQRVLKETTGGMFVVSETRVKYHRPARLDDALLVTVNFAQSGRSSLWVEQQALAVSEKNTQLVLCEGSIRIGWVDAALMKPARIPEIILKALK